MKERTRNSKTTGKKRRNTFVDPKLTQMGSLKLITASALTISGGSSIITSQPITGELTSTPISGGGIETR